ncbi:hypothetical protein ABPG75_003808 [Micractinium tetrahymenae]
MAGRRRLVPCSRLSAPRQYRPVQLCRLRSVGEFPSCEKELRSCHAQHRSPSSCRIPPAPGLIPPPVLIPHLRLRAITLREERSPQLGWANNSSLANMARAALLVLTLAVTATATSALTKEDFKGKHVLLFITDQERATQHFPPKWEEENLPGMTRLKRHGLTFKRAFTNSCMCSAARASLFTGFMPAQTSTYYTLEEDMPPNFYPQNPLSKPNVKPGQAKNAIANLAQMAKAAGYETVYKGKFHLTKPSDPSGEWTQTDLAAYGYSRWNPPDAGADQSLPEGGGNPLGGGNNDVRIMNSTGAPGSVDEGALQYIREVLPKATKPVFLVVSIVNPHDVLFYPNQYEASGYDPALLTGPIKPPITANESLSTKPFVQQFYQKMVVGNLGPDQTLEQQTAYINFYANLIKKSDEFLVNTLNTLDAAGLTNKTLIVRTADHGEMGLSHGTQIQKNFNMYEEATRIPLVFSNPELWPKPRATNALVSHIDFAPTLQSLLAVPPQARYPTNGIDYSSVILDPRARLPQDYVLFTFNDYQSGQNTPPYPPGPAFLRGLREAKWKIVMYFSPDGSKNAATSVQWECYNLEQDPLELRNLGYPGANLSLAEKKELARLKGKLLRVTSMRLGPIPGFQWDLNMTVTTKTGNAVGLPIGRGSGKVTWKALRGGKATGTFAISARSGQIVGTAKAAVSQGGNLYVGTATVTGGSGAYRGFTAIAGKPLELRQVGGKLTLAGRVTSARVDGKLNLTPLNPVTGQ